MGLFGNDQAQSVEQKKPQSGSANLPIDKTKGGGKKENQPVQVAVSNEEAMRIFGIKDIKYSNVA
jgi:hypothetical protein